MKNIIIITLMFLCSMTLFSQIQPITVTAPNGGENWAMGSTQTITWTTTLNSGSVSIQLRRNLSNTMPVTIAQNIPVTDGSFAWIIPALPLGNDYKIRISLHSNASTGLAIFDESDGVFILSGNPNPPLQAITLTSPNGGENWTIGSTHAITWTHRNVTGNVRIELLSPLATFAPTVIAAEVPVENGVFNWTISNIAMPASFYRVGISLLSIDPVYIGDFSDANFTISNDSPTPSITVTSPNGGENWEMGQSYPITWNYYDLTGTVRIDLINPLANALPTIIATEVPIENGVFIWTIPNSIMPANFYRISITWQSMLTVYIGDTSDADFSVSGIPATPSINVTAPNGGETWVKGTMHPITWNTTGAISNVQIALVRNNNINNSTSIIARNVPNTGMFHWNIPNSIPAGTDYKVVIRSFSTNHVLDLSDSSFTIADNNLPRIRVVSPNGGENWIRGTTRNIRWLSSAILTGNVEITLLGGNNTNGIVIAAEAPNNGLYSWSIPATIPIGRNYRIRIRSLSNPAIADISDRPFRIMPSPIVITPVSNSNKSSVSFNITSEEEIVASASVFNIKGQCINKLMTNEVLSGKKTLSWDGLSSTGKKANKGIYFLKVDSGKSTITKKFIY